MRDTLEDCLGLGALEFSWVFGYGRTVVDLGGGVVLGVSAFGQASVP